MITPFLLAATQPFWTQRNYTMEESIGVALVMMEAFVGTALTLAAYACRAAALACGFTAAAGVFTGLVLSLATVTSGVSAFMLATTRAT